MIACAFSNQYDCNKPSHSIYTGISIKYSIFNRFSTASSKLFCGSNKIRSVVSYFRLTVVLIHANWLPVTASLPAAKFFLVASIVSSAFSSNHSCCTDRCWMSCHPTWARKSWFQQRWVQKISPSRVSNVWAQCLAANLWSIYKQDPKSNATNRSFCFRTDQCKNLCEWI